MKQQERHNISEWVKNTLAPVGNGCAITKLPKVRLKSASDVPHTAAVQSSRLMSSGAPFIFRAVGKNLAQASEDSAVIFHRRWQFDTLVVRPDWYRPCS